MSELYRVHILSSNTRTCFFYVNTTDLRDYERHGCAIKIRFGPDHKNLTYGSISLTSVLEVPPKCIGVASLYANNLGLKENEVVLLSHCNVDSIKSLQFFPEKEEDYFILLSCKSLLETYLLSQVSVVAEGQILPIFVFSNISINVEIGKVDVESGFGKLEKFTEIAVLHPLEKPKNPNKCGTDLDNDFKGVNQDTHNHFYYQLRKVLESRINVELISKQKNAESFLKHLVDENLFESEEYKIQPSVLLPDSALKEFEKKFIILSNLKNTGNTYSPYCSKILAEVHKVVDDTNEKPESNDNIKEECTPAYSYVISLNNYDNNIAFCPPHLMEKLNLFVGSKIKIKKISPSTKVKFDEEPKWSPKTNCSKVSECFCRKLCSTRENVRLSIINNFKYNYKINTLIVGGSGTGKTFLLKDIFNEFSNNFIFCNIMQCKSLRGKKIESLHKLWVKNLRECASQEPSLLFLDDLHALTYIDEEEGQFNRLYSDRVVDLMSDMLENFQGKFNISVIATATDMARLSSVVSQRGSRLFQNVVTIEEMDYSERKFALQCVINRKICVPLKSSIDLEKVLDSTNGYTMQDLEDLVSKAVFNCHLRNENLSSLSQVDFDLALTELTPLNLRGINLKKDIVTKWEDVGGMNETKTILTEIFSWPLKYPKILKSCPLRLQRGVLLYGAPGTGKTLLAGALANKCGLNFISVKGPEVLSKYVGASEEGVRNLFIQAQKTQPSLLFFDEFDSLAPKRGHDNIGVTDRVVNQLLTQLDGVESLNGVWVLAATSRPDLLDPALLRPGRLDRMVFCDLPNQVDRLSILEVLSKNLPKSEDVNIAEIASNTQGYTGADLQAVLFNAQMSAIKEEKNLLGKNSIIKVKQIHLTNALSQVKPTLSQREQIRYNLLYEKFVNSRKRNFVENDDGVQKVTFA